MAIEQAVAPDAVTPALSPQGPCRRRGLGGGFRRAAQDANANLVGLQDASIPLSPRRPWLGRPRPPAHGAGEGGAGWDPDCLQHPAARVPARPGVGREPDLETPECLQEAGHHRHRPREIKQ
jgi:hypothetical protein